MATLYNYDDDDNNNNNSLLIYMQIQQPKVQKVNQGQDSVYRIFGHNYLSRFVRNNVKQGMFACMQAYVCMYVRMYIGTARVIELTPYVN